MVKKSKIVNFYEQAGRDLKKLGVVSYPDLKSLSPQQKGWITRKAAEFKEVLKNPQNFAIRKVSKATAQELKGAGYKTTKTNKVAIPLHKTDTGRMDSVKISRGKLIFKGNGITEIVTPSNAANFHDKVTELGKKKLKRNQYLTIKIGDNAPFQSRHSNLGELFYYIKNTFKPIGPKGEKLKPEDLARYMSIVEVTEKTPKNVKPAPDSRTPRAKNKKAGQVTRKNPSGK